MFLIERGVDSEQRVHATFGDDPNKLVRHTTKVHVRNPKPTKRGKKQSGSLKAPVRLVGCKNISSEKGTVFIRT